VLLAIKLALDEWRHWLEGANYQFEVITAHHNLEYIWTLFLTQFNFFATYCPGNKFLKADALSLLSQSEPILLPAIVSPIQWSLDEQIAEASRTEPTLPGGPEGWVYIPSALRLSLMGSVHTSQALDILSLLCYKYWWLI